jgi:RHS repeat-associated protein
VQEGLSANSVARTYVHGGRVDEIVASAGGGSSWLYHQYDARGHCIMLTNTSGGIQEQYEYDAFGQPYIYGADGALVARDLGSPVGNRFLFTGREWLKEVRVYDYRARLYQPELGRFLQPDPKQFDAGDYNLYRYCHNDPVNKSDPFGLLEADHEDKEKAKPMLVEEKNVRILGSNIPYHVRVYNSGNFNDRKTANHATTNLQRDTGKAGLTKGDGNSTVNGHDIDLTLHVNWYYDKNYGGTDVVHRELQHVQDFRTLGNGFTNGYRNDLKDFQMFSGVVKGFNILQKGKYDYDGGPHDLDTHPAMCRPQPEFDNTH